MPPEDLHTTRSEHPVNGNGNGNGNGADPELEQLIELAESRQVPALLGAADATHTIAGPDGPRWRFEGEGTPEGDKVLLRSLQNAIQGIDAKRKREKEESGADG